MAYIEQRRSGGRNCYYLVERYRDRRGRSLLRPLGNLGPLPEGVDTLPKAKAYWEGIIQRCRQKLPKSWGKRKQVIIKLHNATVVLVDQMSEQIRQAMAVETLRRERELRTESERQFLKRQSGDAVHWQAFERLRRQPSDDNALAAKRAFILLAKRYHPDHGGNHDAFLKLKTAYDAARSVMRH